MDPGYSVSLILKNAVLVGSSSLWISDPCFFKCQVEPHFIYYVVHGMVFIIYIKSFILLSPYIEI